MANRVMSHSGDVEAWAGGKKSPAKTFEMNMNLDVEPNPEASLVPFQWLGRKGHQALISKLKRSVQRVSFGVQCHWAHDPERFANGH